VTVAAGSGVAPAPDRSRLALALLLGAIVAISLGVYGAVHDPTGHSLVTLFFTATISAVIPFGNVVRGCSTSCQPYL